MPLERSKPSDPPARRSNDDSRSDPPPSSARSVNNESPCCGKRPRSPRYDLQPEDVGDAAAVGDREETVQEQHDVEGVPSEDVARLEAEDEGEPFAKVARSSPIPPDEDDDDDDELLKFNQQQQKEDTIEEEQDSKPSARRKRETKQAPLPLASNLREFMKPRATKQFRPRPEWYMGDQNGNPNARRRVRSSTPVSPPEQEPLPVPAAVALPFPGLMIAPDSGLLPDRVFDVFADPPAVAFDGGHPPFHLQLVLPPLPLDKSQQSTSSMQGRQQEQIPLVSTFGRDFDPALHVTIREMATEACMSLLEWGAPVEAENAKGVTPLILASQKGNTALVRELLRRGALPSRASSNGTTAVLQAAHFGHMECLELLFRAGGVALMEMANFNHTTPLMRAAQEGHVPIAKMLLDRGASVNRRNRVQMTALMLASQRGHGEVCQVLVNKGAELDSMTAQHSTSLLLACKRGHADVVRVLVTAGCELWVQDSRGRTAREVAQRRDMKDLVPLIDSNVQLHLMQRQQRRQRNYDLVLLWNLLQQERAMVPLVQSSIYKEQQDVPQTARQALLRTMALPAPLLELIAKFMPMPPMWERRVGMLTKRSVINADATVSCALDLIDEVLEEGGFVEACDFAQVVPPTHFASWRDWKKHCRLYCHRGGQVQLPDDHPSDRPVATSATAPKPKDNPSVLEMRRQVGFLQILANRTPLLAHVLAHKPYNMPRPLIQQLITSSDIQSLVRRMGSRGVHFEPTVAMDLIMLASRLCSWYSREREDKAYPIYPAVVHPPLPQPRQRVLPMRVPLDIVNVPFQYDPYQMQQPSQEEAELRERPSAPAPRPI